MLQSHQHCFSNCIECLLTTTSRSQITYSTISVIKLIVKEDKLMKGQTTIWAGLETYDDQIHEENLDFPFLK